MLNNSIWEMSIFQKLKYFSYFEAVNCDSNSSFKWGEKRQTIPRIKIRKQLLTGNNIKIVLTL